MLARTGLASDALTRTLDASVTAAQQLVGGVGEVLLCAKIAIINKTISVKESYVLPWVSYGSTDFLARH